jgi:hypothetical protein
MVSTQHDPGRIPLSHRWVVVLAAGPREGSTAPPEGGNSRPQGRRGCVPSYGRGPIESPGLRGERPGLYTEAKGGGLGNAAGFVQSPDSPAVP